MNALRLCIYFPLLITAACSHSLEPGDSQYSAFQDGILYTLSLDAVIYTVQDTLTGQFYVDNHSVTIRSFKFANVQQYGYRLRDQSGLVLMSGPNIVQPALSSFELGPGQRKAYDLNLLLRDHAGRWMVSGRYTFEMFLSDGDYPTVSVQITIL
jgi:hypothetical protein